jgi:hypothetical protein
MRLRTVVVVVAALGLGVGPALAGGSSLREQANPGFLKAQTSIRSQVSGKWTKPLPAPCGTFLLPTQPCLYPYKGAQKLPQGIVMIPPIKLPPLPWLTLSEELLVATNVTVVPTSLFECKYTASGTAMGPYPGTFTQTGTAELTTPQSAIRGLSPEKWSSPPMSRPFTHRSTPASVDFHALTCSAQQPPATLSTALLAPA